MAQDPFYTKLPTPIVPVDGIFKGGGTGGIVYVGSAMALARNQVWFQRTAGTSAGSITAALIAAGYNANEVDYLAAPKGVRSAPPDTLPPGLEPLDYESLQDFPTSPNDVTLESRRNNLIYWAICGPTIEEILKLQAPLSSLDPYVAKVVKEIMKVIPAKIGPFKVRVGPFKAKAGPFKVKVLNQNVKVGPWEIDTPHYDVEVGPFPVMPTGLKDLIQKAVAEVLKDVPRVVKLAETPLLATDALRREFADAVMKILLQQAPILVVYLNFMGDGGVFTGDTFLIAMRRMLEEKVGKHPTRFRDLAMEFACVACDTTSHSLVVYSSKTHPDMEVAEAVRRSMAIPFVFEPRRENGHEIVDGGTMDNLPLGLFLAPDNGFFANGPADMLRVKFGFAPGHAQLGPPMETEKILAKAIPKGGLFPDKLVEITCLNRVFDTAVTNMQESPLLEAMIEAFTKVSKYYEIAGQLTGHSATDFHITKAKFTSMCSLGWTAAIPKIQQGIADGNLNIPGPLDTTNPYGP